MEIEKIENEEDFNKVLQRIDELMNAPKGTPEFDEFQKLWRLVARSAIHGSDGFSLPHRTWFG